MLSVKKLNVVSRSSTSVLVTVSDMVFDNGTLSLIVGKNGSGKSSFLHGLFLHPHVMTTERILYIDTDDVSGDTIQDLYMRGVYYIPQRLVTLSGVPFFSFLHAAYEKKKNKKISVQDFQSHVYTLCDTFDIPRTLVQRNIHEGLSGGEQKLQELIQLIVLSPRYVFLDEIDAHLDMYGREKVVRIITQLQQSGVAIAVISHSFDFAKALKPQYVYEMREGAFVRKGSGDLLETISHTGFSFE